MNLIEIYNKIDLQQIKDFVLEEVEENIFLEFKTANFPDTGGLIHDKRNLSKCLSGFSNSSGGIVVWGIKASTNSKGIDSAKELKPISSLSKFSNWINRNEGLCITPLVEGIMHKKVELNSDEGFLITYIPPSEFCPHMGLFADKHYYKRSGDSFYQCEHWDIVDMMNRIRIPNIKLELSPFEAELRYTKPGGIKNYNFEAVLKILNEGQISAKFPKIELSFNYPYRINQHGLDGNGLTGLKKIVSVKYKIGYYGGSDIIIHAGSELEITKIGIQDITASEQIDDFLLEYHIVSENMKPIKGKVIIESEQLKKIYIEQTQ